ncbi:hypothetical protein HNP93_000993 [Methanococcus maripaludis]|uniref:Uncharacterized protein n=1 Tax=Methanococcus maripaludis TaxID=39152 RepID=A0A7J9P518_METMI|nr:hypothetical protein [Methanococcus maripaludis]MBA2858292.1 hypothetical protein [Methanococcus maripaludis]
MVHYIGEIEVDAISKFEEKQKTNRKSGRSLGKSLPYSRKYGSTPGSVHIQVSLFSEDAKAKAEYLKGLAEANYPIYMDSDRYKGWIDITSEVKLTNYNDMMYEVDFDCDLMPLGQYTAQVVSRKKYISNDFVASGDMIPTVNLPKDTKIIYTGTLPSTSGVLDTYALNTISLGEGKHITPIFVYDTMNSEDETDWVLVVNPETHEFTGEWVVESGNTRLKGKYIFVKDGEDWIQAGELYSVIYGDDCRYLYNPSLDHNRVSLNWKLYSKGNNYSTMKLTINGDTILIDGGASTCVKTILYGSSLGRIINSDMVCKTQLKETSYSLNTGANGWVLMQGSGNMPIVNFSKTPNVPYLGSSSNGYYLTGITPLFTPLVGFKGILSNEAVDSMIMSGTVTADASACSGYSVVGKGNALNVALFQQGISPIDWDIPEGDYVAIVRIMSNNTSTNDIVTLKINDYGIEDDYEVIDFYNTPIENLDPTKIYVDNKTGTVLQCIDDTSLNFLKLNEIHLTTRETVSTYNVNTDDYIKFGNMKTLEGWDGSTIAYRGKNTSGDTVSLYYWEGNGRIEYYEGDTAHVLSSTTSEDNREDFYFGNDGTNIFIKNCKTGTIYTVPVEMDFTQQLLFVVSKEYSSIDFFVTNDIFNVENITIEDRGFEIIDKVSLASLDITASEIDSEWTYKTLEFTKGSNDISISIEPNVNVDDSDFGIDYCVLVPKSHIENLQKQAFCNNDQRITLVPKR